MDLNLKGKNALVCGSTQGIGKATALELANLGANVTLLARNEDKLKSVISELNSSQGQSHAYLVADFSNPDQLRTIVENESKLTPFHILVNNTGGPAGGPIIDAKIEEFTQTFNNHLICNHHLAQVCSKTMRQEGYGRIINVISTSVKQPLANLGVSNTIRGAVANWSKTLAGELGQYNITVNNVLPGATNTVRLQAIAENKAAKTGQSVKSVFESMAGAVPMKRIAEAHEVANAIAFLASPAASYINGINVPVDGGRTGCL